MERKAQGYYFFHIESENRVEIEPLIRKYISPNAKLVVTDGAPVYKWLTDAGYRHEVVLH